MFYTQAKCGKVVSTKEADHIVRLKLAGILLGGKNNHSPIFKAQSIVWEGEQIDMKA